MNTLLRDALLKKCISHYHETYKYGIQLDQKRFGSPPESILIVFGPAPKKDDFLSVSKKEAAFRYSMQGLQEIGTDEADISRVSIQSENGMYYNEAHAELGYDDEAVAFIMVWYGKRYARCYRYNVLKENGNVQLINEKLLWVS